MKRFRELLPKPSDAVQAMIDGLEQYDKDEDFKINMMTFGSRGSSTSKLCFGCAATCAAQHVAGTSLTRENISGLDLRSEALGISMFDLADFETTIDKLRSGGTNALRDYYGVSIPRYYGSLPVLQTNDWKEGLPFYKKYVKFLKGKGL